MVNKFKEINWSPDTAERRKFALTLMAGFPFMGVMFCLIGRLASGAWHYVVPGSIAGIGFTLAVIFWLIPAISLPFYRLWFFLICIIDTVVTHVVLTILFYGVFFPAGLLYRLARAGSFRKNLDRSAATYWEDIPPVQDMRRYYQQF